MIVVAALALVVASVPGTGGRLAELVRLDLRRPWLVVAGFGAQLAAVSAPGVPAAPATGLHLASYGMAGAFLVLNLHVRWMWLVGLGGALNAVAIGANGGVMPASAQAYRIAGVDTVERFTNSRPVEHPRVLALGDVFAVPARWPLSNVFSVGDVLLVFGAALLLHTACRQGPGGGRLPAEPGPTLPACP